MFEFKWLRMGIFEIVKGEEVIGTIEPCTKENSMVTLNPGVEKDSQKIVNAFFHEQ